MTYPKCGTTWTQEIVWTMRNNPDLNHPLQSLPVMARSPFQDMDMLLDAHLDEMPKENDIFKGFFSMCPDKSPKDGMMLQMSEAIPDPRIIKSHLPFSLLPPSLLDTSKVVYVARNPKDVIVSYRHHSRMIKLHGYVGSDEDFVQYFLDDDLLYGPYWLFVKEAWEKRDHPNLHFIFYEDLKADIKKEIKKLDRFLGTNLTEMQIENVIKYTSFGEMKGRDAMALDNEDKLINASVAKKDGGFFRKGETGDWKNKFSPELDAKVDEWIKKNMSPIGVPFKYNI